MKVLMIAPGDSIHSQRPLRQLLDQGLNVVFVDTVNPLNQPSTNYEFIPYPFGRRCWYRRFGQLGDALGLGLIAPWWRSVLRRVAPDVVHAHWIDCRAYYASQAGAKPLILSVWGTDVNHCFVPQANRYHCQVMRGLLKRADLTIVDAPAMRERCQELVGQPLPTELLHLGVNTQLFRPGNQEAKQRWRETLHIPAGAKVVLSIRGLTAHYRHEAILQAFSKIQGNAVLVLKTFNQHDRDYRARLEALAVTLGIASSIRWLPEIPHAQMPELYALADVIVNYPIEDTLPISFVEAAACECPVVSCNLPNYHGTFAEQFLTLVPENTVEALAAALRHTLFEPLNMAPAREFVLNELDETHYIKRLLEIYNSLSDIAP